MKKVLFGMIASIFLTVVSCAQTPSEIYHTITFDSNGGSEVAPQKVKHGEKIIKPDNPTKVGYDFLNWTYQGEEWSFLGYVATEDMTLLANWQIVNYTITFVNYDGSILETQTNKHYGETLIYNGATPTRICSEDNYLYYFSGWDKELTVVGNMTITAQFEMKKSKYYVEYYDYNDELLYKITTDFYNDAFNYLNTKPLREPTDNERFEFSSWKKTYENDGKYIYKATYNSCDVGLRISDGTVEKYDGQSTSVEIPSSWGGKAITAIKQSAFMGCVSIQNVSIPNSISSIERNAFAECSSLSSINIPENIDLISYRLFYNCISLQNIIIPNGVISIEEQAFFGCVSLSSIIIPNSVTSIGMGSFFGCSSLKNIVLPNGITTIGNEAFDNCSFSSIIIPEGTESIGTYSYNKNLKSVVIPDSVVSIPHRAFFGCSSLETVVIGKGVKQIGENAFSNCSSLKTIIIPDSVKNILRYAFSNCSSLKTIIIPDSVTSIGESVLLGCSSVETIRIPFFGNNSDKKFLGYFFGYKGSANMSVDSELVPKTIKTITVGDACEEIPGFAFSGRGESITIGKNISSIEKSALSSCKSLLSLHVAEGNESYFESDNVLYDKQNNCDFYCIQNESGTIVIPEGIDKIGSSFQNHNLLENIILPSSIKTIGYESFIGCSSLKTINIPEGVISIGEYAFYNCSSIISIDIPNSVTSIGREAFENCSSLEHISFGDGIVYSSYGALFGCSSLKTINLGKNWKFLNGTSDDFRSLMSMESVFVSEENENYSSVDGVLYDKDITTLLYLPTTRTGEYHVPNSISRLSTSSFWNCPLVTSISVGESNVTYSSANEALCNKEKTELIYCPSGKTGEYTVSDGIDTIGFEAFSLCPLLESIVFPEGVEAFGMYSMRGCKSLKSISIPHSIKTFGYECLYSCTNLSDVYYNGTIEEWTKLGSKYINNESVIIHCLDGDVDISGSIVN